MLILNRTSNPPAEARKSAIAIGNFDGVHRGHRVLLDTARSVARAKAVPSAAMLFEPHPRELFQPDKPHFRLTPLPRKLTLLAAQGLDVAVVIAFDRSFASLSAEAFIAEVLVRDLAVSHVVVGYDFQFGKGRTGTPALLKDAGARMGFGVSVVEPVGVAGQVYSSSAIRACLAKGDVRRAGGMLGHWWRVAGTVVGGAKRGTGLGFPTANLALPDGVELGYGIFAVRVWLDGQCHLAAAYNGTRPTFDNGKPVLEVFLLDFDGNLYGREIEVEFVDFIREDRKFDSMDAIKAQMAADCDVARQVLAAAPPAPGSGE